MPDARSEILSKVRSNRAAAMDLPSLDHPWQTFPDAFAQFRALLSSIGAQSHLLSDLPAANAWLNDNIEYARSKCCVSLVADVGRSTIDLNELATPHELRQLDWAVLNGEFGVAENGAIWVTARPMRYRAVCFLCEHMVLVLPRHQILDNMHQAFERLAQLGEDDDTPFGTFVAGPSKTADIEQSLVIGAQGPRSLDVLILEKT